MEKFTAQDAIRPRWSPEAKPRAVRWFASLGLLCAIATVALWFGLGRLAGTAYLLAVLALVVALLGVVTCLGAAIVVQFAATIGRLLFRFAFPIFLAGIIGIIVVAWSPALLYGVVDQAQAAPDSTARAANAIAGPLSVVDIYAYLTRDGRAGSSGLWTVAAYALWPLQFQLTRDIIAMIGAVGFVSLVACFAIWWERKVAGRIQSRLGPMRVGGWHGWAQSIADGLKLIQKEDVYLEGADRPLYQLAPYLAFVPALSLFIALPFSAAWIARDLDVGLIFILAMLVALLGWIVRNGGCGDGLLPHRISRHWLRPAAREAKPRSCNTPPLETCNNC